MIPVFNPVITNNDIKSVLLSLRRKEISGNFSHSIIDLEERFANYCGSRFGVAVSSGTTALHLASYHGHLKIVEFLVEQLSDPGLPPPLNGATPSRINASAISRAQAASLGPASLCFCALALAALCVLAALCFCALASLCLCALAALCASDHLLRAFAIRQAL
jgi:ankyrin repeat protein